MKKSFACKHGNGSAALWLAGSCLAHLLVLFGFGSGAGSVMCAVEPAEVAVQIVEFEAPLAALSTVTEDVPRQPDIPPSQEAVYGNPVEASATIFEAGEPVVEKSAATEKVGEEISRTEGASSRDEVLAPATVAETLIVRATPLSSGNRRPEYPRVARQRGWEGEVLVWVLVSHLGRVVDSGLEKSSGFDALDHSALKAVRGWRFNPAMKNGLPVESLLHVPIAFLLERR